MSRTVLEGIHPGPAGCDTDPSPVREEEQFGLRNTLEPRYVILIANVSALSQTGTTHSGATNSGATNSTN